MILVAIASAAELTQESIVSTGVEATLTLTVTDQKAMLGIQNLGSAPFVIDWEASSITPIGGVPENLVPGGADRPEAGVLVAPLELAAGATFSLRPIPRSWIEDGPENDPEQWASWDQPGAVTVTLAILGPEGDASVQGIWRRAAVPEVPLAIPVAPEAPSNIAGPVPTLPAEFSPTPASVAEQHALQLQRVDWARTYNRYRRQEAIARVFWITGGTIGVIGGLSALSAATGAIDAPDEPAEGQNSREQLLQATRVYGIASGVGFAVAIPAGIWDFSTRKKRRQLGPRP